jgi:hypothetical protein
MSLREKFPRKQTKILGESVIRSDHYQTKSVFLRVEKTNGQRHYISWSGLSDMDYEPGADADSYECLHLVFMNREVIVQGWNLGKIAGEIEKGHHGIALCEVPATSRPPEADGEKVPVIVAIEVRKRFGAPPPPKPETPMHGPMPMHRHSVAPHRTCRLD